MRGKSCRSWSGDRRTGPPSGAAGPAGRAAAAAAATSPGEGSSGGRGEARLAGLKQRAHPTQRQAGGRAGAGGPLPLGPGDLGAAPERRMSLGSRAFAPRVGEEWVGDRVGAARERALVLARGWACLYARGRARCAGLQVRVAADVRVLGPDSSVPGAAARGLERLSGARTRPRTRASGRAPCCWVAAPPRGRAGHPCCAERWRAGAWLCAEGCGLGPSCSGDVPGPLGGNQPALRSGERLRSAARRVRALALEEGGAPRPRCGWVPPGV